MKGHKPFRHDTTLRCGFSLKRKTVLAIILVLIFTAAIISYRQFIRHSRRPNIFLLTFDALRPDHLSCYGYQRNTSPFVDKIAQEGILFTQAISQSNWTAPSVVSLLTSTYPVMHETTAWGMEFPREFVSLPRLLKAYGFTTICITEHSGFDAIINMDEEFDSFSTVNTSQIVEGRFIRVTDLKDRIIKLITKNKHKKFFLWVHFLNPHVPLNPPPPYHTMFLNDEYAKEESKIPISKSLFGGVGGLPKILVNAHEGITDLSYYLSLYDGAIRYVDDQIGSIFECLQELGLEADTVTIISSDHGESLGEHNLYFSHVSFLYDTLVKVPLVIRYKKMLPSNMKIDAQVQLIDIVPTILDILKIKKPSTMEGKSLLSLMHGKENIYSNNVSFSSIANNLFSIRTPKWKLIYNRKADQYELYNLRKDPAESNNLYPHLLQSKDIFLWLENELEEHIKKENRYKEKKRESLSGEMRRKLKALGYLQ